MSYAKLSLFAHIISTFRDELIITTLILLIDSLIIDHLLNVKCLLIELQLPTSKQFICYLSDLLQLVLGPHCCKQHCKKYIKNLHLI